MNRLEWLNSMLAKEFDQYVRDHPEFAQQLPKGAMVALQMEGDDEFNDWSRRLAQAQADEDQSIVYIHIKKLREHRSRIEDLEMLGTS